MDRSTPIMLLSTTKAQDAYGVWVESPTSRMVFCQVDSVTRAEFFDGGRNGLNPEYRMTMFFGDYNGEKLLSYNGQTYSVYRTYQGKNDTIELYVERKGGTNGKGQ
jgi:hypothetical protein